VPRGRRSLEYTKSPRRRIALVTAPLVTALVVGTGVATSGFVRPEASSSTASANLGSTAAEQDTSVSASDSANARDARALGTSRSTERVPLVDNRVPEAKGKLWTTSDLNLRVQPAEKSKVAGLLESGSRIPVTGRKQGAYVEVIVNQVPRWVTADYLSKNKQVLSKNKAPGAVGVSDQPCPDGSSIESGLQPAAVRTYRAVCAAFPELSAYGGQDGHGEHVNGQAIDFMVPDSSIGQRVADYLYAHHAEFDLFDIIWSQHIWTIERSGEGFRSMSDRGSPTANHFDHVHIMVN
jgi:uncharacterized protein YgiM (DUF1202 family)